MAESDFPFYRPGRSEYDDTMSRASTVIKRKRKVEEEKFALGRRGILVFFTLSVLTLMAALDGTSLSVALPVSASARRLYVSKLITPRKLQKNSMEQLLRHSGVGLRSCYAQQVGSIMLLSTMMQLIDLTLPQYSNQASPPSRISSAVDL